ncbi:MAG: hypothetical protein GOVbin4296_56 [Prokaryotic dsDNA virus sp.]|nr:MAG: hypothetical protein GOVbin4296_56 [Prokaryotic dsDNA virus sp.]|tara:strand:- start:8549 stop:10132 length:1584 start_codon:yes stop_codon:yes gene_type:complete
MPLLNTPIKDKYKDLLSIDNSNTGATGLTGGAAKYIEDGDGTNFNLSVGQTKIGVGTESPLYDFDVVGTGTTLRVKSGSYARLRLESIVSNDTQIYFDVSGSTHGKLEFNNSSTDTNRYFMFDTGVTERSYLKGDMLGLGAISPGSNLYISSTKDPISDLNDNKDYQVIASSSETTTDKTVGIGFQVDSAADNVGAAIIHQRKGNNSQGSLYVYTKTSNIVNANPARMMAFESTGKISISPYGTISTAATSALHLYQPNNNADGGMAITSSGSKTIMLYGDGTSTTIKSGGNYDLKLLRDSDTNNIVLGSSGVGIYTTSPTAALDVTGNVKFSGNLLASDGNFYYNGTANTLSIGLGAGAANGTLDIKDDTAIIRMESSNTGSVIGMLDYKLGGVTGDFRTQVRNNSNSQVFTSTYHHENGDATQRELKVAIGNSAAINQWHSKDYLFFNFNSYLNQDREDLIPNGANDNARGVFIANGGLGIYERGTIPTGTPAALNGFGFIWVDSATKKLKYRRPDGTTETITST